ncbi:hypothetical protein COLO4_16105 [Corchorus olitorius]|uniref:Uncharacterized protein n=1 Tax=Corchorus olitorius TaxID=93759 RepID=A0A1R3JJJ1_9ROSI|nr:hypothetical protein COLO4_16105 [Corchorus olitorius]
MRRESPFNGDDSGEKRGLLTFLSQVLKDKPKERIPSWLQSANSPGILLSL